MLVMECAHRDVGERRAQVYQHVEGEGKWPTHNPSNSTSRLCSGTNK